MEKEDRKNRFAPSIWFDTNFLVGFLGSANELKKQFNDQKYSISEEKISSRLLNHYYLEGIVDDDRPNGKGWKKFSISEIIWIQIIVKLRRFGLDLKRIKAAKDEINQYKLKDSISKFPLLDFYSIVALQSNEPIKFIVFESGEAHIVRQIDIDIANQVGLIVEDFISIDINRLVSEVFTKKTIQTDYLNYSNIPKSPLIKEIENSLSAKDIQSITIRVKNQDYLVDEEFFTKDKVKANALMSALKFGRLVENRNGGKSTYQITNKKKLKKGRKSLSHLSAYQNN